MKNKLVYKPGPGPLSVGSLYLYTSWPKSEMMFLAPFHSRTTKLYQSEKTWPWLKSAQQAAKCVYIDPDNRPLQQPAGATDHLITSAWNWFLQQTHTHNTVEVLLIAQPLAVFIS